MKLLSFLVSIVLVVAIAFTAVVDVSAASKGSKDAPQMYIFGPGFPEMTGINEYFLYDIDYGCVITTVEVQVVNAYDPMDQASYFYETNTVLFAFYLEFNSNSPYFIDALVRCDDGREGSVSGTLGEPFLSYVGALSTNQIPVTGFAFPYATNCFDPNYGTPVITLNVGESLNCDVHLWLGDLITGSVDYTRTTQLAGQTNGGQSQTTPITLDAAGDAVLDMGTFTQPGTYYVWAQLMNRYSVQRSDKMIIVHVI